MSQKIEIKPYNLKELAFIYGVCRKTFKKWIEPFDEEIGDKKGRFFNIKQVRIIFDKLGIPKTFDIF